MEQVKVLKGKELEDQYRLDMQYIVNRFAIDKVTPVSKENCESPDHVVDLLLHMNAEYVLAACHFMGYPVSYAWVVQTMNEYITELYEEAEDLYKEYEKRRDSEER